MALGRNPEGAKKSKRSLVTKVVVRLPQGNRKFTALIDCGAEENFISQRLVVEEGLPSLPSSMRGRTIDGHRVTIYGEHKLKTFAIDANGIRRLSEQTFFGAEMVGYDLILGWSWLETENPDCDWTAGKWYYREKYTPVVIALEPDQFRKKLRDEI